MTRLGIEPQLPVGEKKEHEKNAKFRESTSVKQSLTENL